MIGIDYYIDIFSFGPHIIVPLFLEIRGIQLLFATQSAVVRFRSSVDRRLQKKTSKEKKKNWSKPTQHHHAQILLINHTATGSTILGRPKNNNKNIGQRLTP